MRIKLLTRTYVAGSSRRPGETIVVDEATARRHVEAGEATALDAFSPRGTAGFPPPELTGENAPVAPSRDGEVVVKYGAAETRLVTMVDGRTVKVPREGRS